MWLKRALTQILIRLAKVLTPPDRLKISDWTERYAYLPAEGNAEPGKYRVSRMPYQRDMLDDPLDQTVVETVWMIGSQLGKTLCIILIIEYFIHHLSSSILVVYPTLDSAKAWIRDKFLPTTRDTPCMTGLLKEPRARDSESTTLNRKFPGGNLTACGANSPASLRQRSKRVVIIDEVDAMPVTSEGDPVALADMRAETFHDAVKLKSSTPTIKGASRIEEIWDRSDKQRFFVPCPCCAHMQWLKWSQVRFSFKQPDGTEKRDTKSTVYICEAEKCQAAWTDAQRIDAINDRRAEWRATAPFTGVRGRHLSGLYRTIGKKKAYRNYLHEFAEEFLKAAKGGPQTLRVWFNTFLAETFEESVERIDHAKILERVEKYTPDTLPNEVVLALAAIDVQKDRVEVETIGLGIDDETWGIEHRQIFGNTEQDDVWQDLADHLGKTYKRVDDVQLRITAAAIDMRHKPNKVRAFVRYAGLPRVYPVYGVNSTGQPILVTTRFNKHYCLRTYAVAGKIAKDMIFARLRMTDKGPRYMHYPAGNGYTDEYFQQLTAEVLKRKKERGVTTENYEKIRDRNEALDIRVYFLAAIDILKPNISAIAKHQKPPKPGDPETGPKEYQLKPDPTKPAPASQKPKSSWPRKPGGGGQFNPLGL